VGGLLVPYHNVIAKMEAIVMPKGKSKGKTKKTKKAEPQKAEPQKTKSKKAKKKK